MHWKQLVDPFDNITLSALAALLPILFVFWALLVKKMKGYQASLLATALAIPIAVFIYQMPANRIARPRNPFEINVAPCQHPLLKNSAMASGCRFCFQTPHSRLGCFVIIARSD